MTDLRNDKQHNREFYPGAILCYFILDGNLIVLPATMNSP